MEVGFNNKEINDMLPYLNKGLPSLPPAPGGDTAADDLGQAETMTRGWDPPEDQQLTAE